MSLDSLTADADILPRAITHPSQILHGQGPYGATPHPQTALFHIQLTERLDVPSELTSIRLDVKPEIEELRARLRKWMADRDDHYFFGAREIVDGEGKVVGYGRRKREGVKELGGFGIVGVEKKRSKVVFQ